MLHVSLPCFSIWTFLALSSSFLIGLSCHVMSWHERGTKYKFWIAPKNELHKFGFWASIFHNWATVALTLDIRLRSGRSFMCVKRPRKMATFEFTVCFTIYSPKGDYISRDKQFKNNFEFFCFRINLRIFQGYFHARIKILTIDKTTTDMTLHFFFFFFFFKEMPRTFLKSKSWDSVHDKE